MWGPSDPFPFGLAPWSTHLPLTSAVQIDDGLDRINSDRGRLNHSGVHPSEKKHVLN